MILVFPTICHTGSKLLVNIFGGQWQPLNQKPKEGVHYYDHLYQHNVSQFKSLMGQYPSIVSLRHPYLTATSWRRNGKDVGEMCVMWYVLVEMMDKYNPYYLPVDAPDRDDYLQKINEGLGLNRKTDWPLVNCRHHTTEPDLGEDEEQVERLCHNIRDFLNRFYSAYDFTVE